MHFDKKWRGQTTLMATYFYGNLPSKLNSDKNNRIICLLLLKYLQQATKWAAMYMFAKGICFVSLSTFALFLIIST
jgi:hypothetical protein